MDVATLRAAMQETYVSDAVLNWTDLSASGDLVDRAGTLGLVAADGTVTYTSSSTQGVCAAGVELYPA